MSASLASGGRLCRGNKQLDERPGLPAYKNPSREFPGGLEVKDSTLSQLWLMVLSLAQKFLHTVGIAKKRKKNVA